MISFTRQLAATALIVGFWLLASSPARAAGFGVYFDYARGIGEGDPLDLIDNLTDNKYNVGFVMDTAVARDTLFNYRLKLGYQRTSREVAGIKLGDLNGVTLNNTFGFGVYRGPHARVWLGPSVRIGTDVLENGPSLLGGESVDVTLGGGIDLGVNVHTGNLGSASITFGYQYVYLGIFTDSAFPDEHGGQHLIAAGITYLFRSSGDRYLGK